MRKTETKKTQKKNPTGLLFLEFKMSILDLSNSQKIKVQGRSGVRSGVTHTAKTALPSLGEQTSYSWLKNWRFASRSGTPISTF